MKIAEGMENQYKQWFSINTDWYGRECFVFAETWANILEKLMRESSENPEKIIIENAEEVSKKANLTLITGFQYGAAKSILRQCWKYKEEFKEWENKEG